MNVWIVYTGYYSDREIDSVWSSKSLADDRRAELAKIEYSDVSGPEEFVVDDPERVQQARTVWHFDVYKNGLIKSRGEKLMICPEGHSDILSFRYGDCIARTTSAISGEHAKKLAVESWQAYLRGKNGGTDETRRS